MVEADPYQETAVITNEEEEKKQEKSSLFTYFWNGDLNANIIAVAASGAV